MTTTVKTTEDMVISYKSYEDIMEDYLTIFNLFLWSDLV